MQAWATAIAAPGVFIHEMCHAVAAAPVADVRIDWGGWQPVVNIQWAESPSLLRLTLVFLAPVVAGGLALIVGGLVLEELVALPWPIQVWLSINWIVLAGPSLLDLRELKRSVMVS